MNVNAKPPEPVEHVMKQVDVVKNEESAENVVTIDNDAVDANETKATDRISVDSQYGLEGI